MGVEIQFSVRDDEFKAELFDSVMSCPAESSIIIKDSERRILAFNAGAQKNYGYTEEEVLGQDAKMLHVESEEEDVRFHTLHDQCRKNGVATGKFERLRKDGTSFWAYVTLMNRTNADGEHVGYLLMSRDLTKENALQDEADDKAALLSSIMRAPTESSIIAKNLDREILVWNEGAARNYGYTEAEVAGKNAMMLHVDSPEENLAMEQLHRKCLEEGSATGTFERLRKDGSSFTAYVVLTRLDDVNGNPSGYLLMSRDVTEDRRIREELLDAQEQLRADILELSTPVMQVWDRVLALPIIGTLDSGRTQAILENLLMAINQREAEVVILDVSGVPAIDSIVGQNLIKTAKAAKIMGAQTIISGIRPETAQTIVDVGIDFQTISTKSKLQDALRLAQRLIQQADEGL